MRTLARLVLLAAGASALKPLAIVTGGTRGVGRGISESLAAAGYDLLLAYSADKRAAQQAAAHLCSTYHCVVECVCGDLAQPEARDALFTCFDSKFRSTHALRVVVHNAGQYVGITSENAYGLRACMKGFGDGTLLDDDGNADLEAMRYYQRLYGEAYVDLMERALVRIPEEGGGTLIGISSPGCTTQFKVHPGYDLPGSGKCVMEYAMRLFALRCAARNINCNVVVPGVTDTEAWGHLAARRGTDREELVRRVAARVSPMGSMTPRQLGDAVAFLCSPHGRFLTGLSLPVDGGVHLKT